MLYLLCHTDTISVNGKGLDPSFSNTSTLTVSDCMRFGAILEPKYTPTENALYVDPATGKLSYVDSKGVVHSLY